MASKLIVSGGVCSAGVLLVCLAAACSDDDDFTNNDGAVDADARSDATSGRDASDNADVGTTSEASADAVVVDAAVVDAAVADAAVADAAVADGGEAPPDAASAFWEQAYNTGCKKAKKAHNSGQACMNCHPGGGAPDFIAAGTIAEIGDAVVEIGIRDGTHLLTSCTNSQGDFWFGTGGNSPVDWASAEIRLRTADGETAEVRHPDIEANNNCNSCHADGTKLAVP